MAIALVLIGVVTLVIGIISNTLAWVFISIGATVAAGIVLYVLYRLGRKQAAAGVGTYGAADQATAQQPAVPAAPVVPAPTAVPPPAPAAAPETADAGFAPVPAGSATEEIDADRLAPSPVVTALPDSYDDEEELFPIAEYDDLRVAEILPLLPELDADELDVVREREAATKGRATILNRIDELAPNALGAWTDGAREEPAEAPAPAAAPAAAGRRTSSAMPIPGYDDLTVAEILPALTRLGAADLEVVAQHERQGPNRQTVLNRIDGRIRSLEKGAGDQPAPVPARTTRSARTTTRGSTAQRSPATPTPTALPTAAKRAGAGRPTAPRATKATAAAVPAKRGRPAKAAPAPAAKATTRKAPAAAPAKAAKAAKTAGPARRSTKAASPAPAPRTTKRSSR